MTHNEELNDHLDERREEQIAHEVPCRRGLTMRGKLLLVLGLCLLPGADAPEEARDELKRLQGTWVMAALEIDGRPVPEDQLRDTTLAIRGDKYIVKSKGKTYETTFTLDPGPSPQAIDLSFPDGTNAPKKGARIYQLEGDTFTLCRRLTPGRTGRPSSAPGPAPASTSSPVSGTSPEPGSAGWSPPCASTATRSCSWTVTAGRRRTLSSRGSSGYARNWKGRAAWPGVTAGREIENYIPVEALRAALGKPELAAPEQDGDVFAHVGTKDRKLELAHLIVPRLTKEMLQGTYDLPAQLDRVCRQIRTWNGQPEGA
jgi:uncharacterized protein (TIGR03067 family)